MACLEFNPFMEAVSRIAKEPYNEDNNCYDHSQKLQQIFADQDIESSIMVSENRDHAWLAVWLESTTGEFMPIDNSYNVIEVRNRDLEVICHD